MSSQLHFDAECHLIVADSLKVGACYLSFDLK
jgi:hypothetical protein